MASFILGKLRSSLVFKMSSLDSSAFESNEEDYLAKLHLRHRKLTKRSPSQCNRNNSNNDSASDDDGAGGDGAKSKTSLEGRFGDLEDSDVEEVIDVEESSGLPRAVYEQCQKSFEGNRFKPILQGIKGHKLEKYMRLQLLRRQTKKKRQKVTYFITKPQL